MALINCSECGKSFPEESEACPHCGTPKAPSHPEDHTRGTKAVFEAKDIRPVPKSSKPRPEPTNTASPEPEEKPTLAPQPAGASSGPSHDAADQAGNPIDIRSMITGMIIVGLLAAGVFAWLARDEPAPIVTAGAETKPTTAEPKRSTSEIQAEIAALQSRIEATQHTTGLYSGGLIKSVLESTLAIQQQTLEMLEQRENSWTFGIGLMYSVEGTPFNPPQNAATLIEDIERETASTQLSVTEADAKAAQYSGGLIRATLLTTSATGRQTLAMLQQRKLALQFGLPQFVGFSQEASPHSDIPQPQAINPTPAEESRQWEIVSIDTKVTEQNNVYWQYAWKLTLKNFGDTDQGLSGKIEFQDEDGFIIDTSKTGGMHLKAGQATTFTGKTFIRLPGAKSVARTHAKVHER